MLFFSETGPSVLPHFLGNKKYLDFPKVKIFSFVNLPKRNTVKTSEED